MSSPSSPQHEPTMEEILASIRKIISEDSNEPQPAPQVHAQVVTPPPAPPQPVHEADVLELTQEVEEEPAPAPIAPPPPAPVMEAAPPPPPAPEPVRPADDIVFESIEDEPVSHTAAAPSHSTEDLVSDKARSAIDDALSGLDFGHDEGPEHAAPVAPIDGHSVEGVFDRAIRETFDPVLRQWLHDQADVIVERMKPAIREWMEDHLPAMLKGAVEAEVARAVRARTKR